MAIVYLHRRLDIKDDFKNVFYIGIGKSEKRAYQKNHSRSKHWKSIVDKYGFSIQITHNNISWEDACVIEKYLISFYGRKDMKQGELCNMTDGGDGILVWSDELKQRHSEKQKLVQGSPEAKRKNRERALKMFPNENDRKLHMAILMEKARSEEGRIAISKGRIKYFLLNGVENHTKLMKKIHGTSDAIRNNRNTKIQEWSSKRDLPTGVYKHGNGYRAKASIKNKPVHILYSKSIEECHQAYLNFISNL